MKFLVLAICVCAAAAAPQFRQPGQFASAAFAPAAKAYSGDEKTAEILRSESDVKPDSYSYAYETSNGISAQENGALKKVTDVESIVAQGSYQFTSPEGKVVQLTYVADENGYQPASDVLPTPPPTPEHVLRLLDFIAKNPPPPETVAFKKNF